MSERENFNFKLELSPIAASSIACLISGVYVGYNHAQGEDTTLITPVITTSLEAHLQQEMKLIQKETILLHKSQEKPQ